MKWKQVFIALGYLVIFLSASTVLAAHNELLTTNDPGDMFPEQRGWTASSRRLSHFRLFVTPVALTLPLFTDCRVGAGNMLAAR